MRRTEWLLRAGAAAVLLAGFGDLALGGMTVAAVLLVTGYCIAVPVAILGLRRADP